MRTISFFSLITIIGIVTLNAAANEHNRIIGSVNAANLNVRVKPSTKFTAVARLKYGDTVEVVSQHGDWYEIAAPKKSSVWVSASFIKDNQTTRKVNFRSGPGINYQAYGTVPAGQTVTVLSDLSHEWTKIAPTPGLTAWVFAKYVKLTSDDLKRLNEPVASPETKPLVKVKREEVKLPFIAGFAQPVKYSGTVWKLEEQGKYVTHALVNLHNGKAQPLCFLRIECTDKNKWNNKTVTIRGIKKLVKDWKLPVVIVKSEDITM